MEQRRRRQSKKTKQIEAPCSITSINNTALLRDLFQAVPNLTTVHLSLPPQITSSSPAARSVTAVSSPSTGLTHSTQLIKLPASLRTLQLSGPDDKGMLDLSCIFLQQQPSWSTLRAFDLCGCSTVVPTPLPPVPALFHDLTKLSLSQTKMDLTSFQSLLRTIGPGLTSVFISTIELKNGDFDAEMEWIIAHNFTVPLPVDGVIHALMPWAHTLREFAYTVDDHHPLVLRMPVLSELSSFRVLVSLWLESAHFRLYEDHDAMTAILPPILNALRLSGLSRLRETVDQLHEAKKASMFQDLDYLIIDEQVFDLLSYDAAVALDDTLNMLRGFGMYVTALPVYQGVYTYIE